MSRGRTYGASVAFILLGCSEGSEGTAPGTRDAGSLAGGGAGGASVGTGGAGGASVGTGGAGGATAGANGAGGATAGAGGAGAVDSGSAGAATGGTGVVVKVSACDGLAPEGTFEEITPPAVKAGIGTKQPDGQTRGGTFAIAVDPVNQGTVYAGTLFQKVWKSTDCGATWKDIATGTNGA